MDEGLVIAMGPVAASTAIADGMVLESPARITGSLPTIEVLGKT